MVSVECIVVGAGPSGLIAARELAKYGISVEVYERKKEGAQIKNSSGILSLNGLKSLQINYKQIILNKLYGADIHFPKVSLHIHSKKLQAYSIDRTLLNAELRGEAESEGARIFYNRPIGKEELKKRGKIIIGADGAVSNVASFFSFPKIERFILTYRAEYKKKKEDMESVELFFDNSITKGFFGWVAPHGDGVEAGVGIDERYGRSSKAFELFLRKKEVREIIGDSKPILEGASIIPISLRKKFVDEKNRVLLVGDAAGQVKSSTGGGIIFGGNASITAAKVVKEYLEGNAQLSDYQKIWLKEFGKEIMLHNLIHSLYSSPNALLSKIALFLKFIGIERILSEYGDMDRPSRIIENILSG